MKELKFLGSSLSDLKAFPNHVIQDAGYQLHLVQLGRMPKDFKTMLTVGAGVNEIRLKDKDGIYRVVYTAKIGTFVYVLHAFTKKTQKTSKQDIDLARKRYKQLLKMEQKMTTKTYQNVWDALCEDPVERATLKMRSDIMVNIEKTIKENGWTQTQAAKHCKVSQPRINDLLTGKLHKFSLDALVKINANLGKSIELNFVDNIVA